MGTPLYRLPGETGAGPPLTRARSRSYPFARTLSPLIDLFKDAAESLCAALFPGVCPICSEPMLVLGRLPVCQNCWNSLARYEGPMCRDCGRPFLSSIPLSGVRPLCGFCRRGLFHFEKARYFGLYQMSLRRQVLLVKFARQERLGYRLGQKLAEVVGSWEEFRKCERIVPVPLHPLRQRERGFNQAEALAQGLAGRLGIPVDRRSLRRVQPTPPQTGLSSSARRKNVREAFAVQGSSLQGLSVLLVDDVITTGATADACALRLKRAGVKKVYVLTLARSEPLLSALTMDSKVPQRTPDL